MAPLLGTKGGLCCCVLHWGCRRAIVHGGDMRDQMKAEELERVRDWAREKIQGGNEPPWSWYQHMKLIETLDAILSGMAATITKEDSQPAEPHPEKHLRLVGPADSQDTSRPRHVGL